MSLNKKALASDLVKVATFNVVAHVLMHVRFGDALFDSKFIYSLIFILLGFTLYHVAVDYHVVALFKEKVKATVIKVKDKIAKSSAAKMIKKK